MLKKRPSAKLALHSETVRALSENQLRGVVGGGSGVTGTSCSTDWNPDSLGDCAYTCKNKTVVGSLCNPDTTTDLC